MSNKLTIIGLICLLIISSAALCIGLSASSALKKQQNDAQSKNAIGAGQDKIASQLQDLSTMKADFITTGEPIGYIITFENKAKFYFAGDTGLISDMKLIVGDYYKPDVAFLPIGNYYTMDHKAAAYAASLVNPTTFVIPNHYASYPMLEQDPTLFFQEIAKYNLKAKPLKFDIGAEQDVMGVKTLWLGHGDWRFTSPSGTAIMIDPEVEYNPLYPEGYKDLSKFGRLDLILITHGHFDHMTIPDLKKWVKQYDPIIIAPFEAGVWLKEHLPTKNIMAINKGADITKDEMKKMGMPEEKVNQLSDVRINLVAATHSSSATPEGMSAKY